ncbi:MAG: Fe-S cluster assembly transcriptional regulator IscR [Methylophilaceae bacterium]|jgi:Rrf2 family iron-sulfur cluster assembly transcriptional regulator|uniref:Fe-S cluster assembly transcriptional regulator IscR n=1 Tax=Methyloradius palustris TaxID=2778876 RepID=A0A8D5GCC1_9PROT|nr:Fe-S cluster assembly transcriptional regulator IscR [Methyloradius palustris]BCM25666.1 Fe-S cluster assembly transcriptional regulator IscR [Methyloradius palustris]HSH97088.1 Fe-S cluster assembly transcriptional regulator IscR [Methyloradius sp.]
MRLTTKGRFAVTAMLDLALNEVDKPVTLAGISERQGISLSYLEQLFSRLRRGGLVKSVRGPGGGYRIAKKHNEISVSQIISAVDELIDATSCGGEENCHDDRRCMTHDLWSSLNIKILEYLSGVSLADLVKSQLEGSKNIFAARPELQIQCVKVQKQVEPATA